MTAAGRKQRGVVLVVSLVVLMLIGFLAAGSYETNLMQLRMAGNAQAKTQALQTALGLVDAIMAEDENFPLDGAVGQRLCAAGVSDPRCDEDVIRLDETLVWGSGVVDYFTLRRAPLQVALPVLAEDTASSHRYYRAALFEVGASYTGTGLEPARASVVQGVLIRLAVSADQGG